MSILTGPEIIHQYTLGNIEIDPFVFKNVGPNSLDCRLGGVLLEILDEELDMTQPVKEVNRIEIPRSGHVLKKGVGYLGFIVERIKCIGFVPYIDGRSTTGRYFVQTHTTAGKGDSFWKGHFTVELMAIYKPVRVFAGLPMFQITFHTTEGKPSEYSGRYQDQPAEPKLPVPLKMPIYDDD